MAARRYEISLLVLKNIFQHEKRNFVSPSERVIFSLPCMNNLHNTTDALFFTSKTKV